MGNVNSPPSLRFSRVFSHPVSCFAFEIVMVLLHAYFLAIFPSGATVALCSVGNPRGHPANFPLQFATLEELQVGNGGRELAVSSFRAFPVFVLPSLPSSSVALMGTLGPFCILKAAGRFSPRARSSNL